MAKFRIIEENRLMKSEEMAKVKGGDFTCYGIHEITCSGGKHYATCSSAPANYTVISSCATEYHSCGITTLFQTFCSKGYGNTCGILENYGF